jgi:tetratricopeptide (TPR) repeat protein
LELGPSPAVEPRIVYHLGITCLHGGRHLEADKLFTRLLEDEEQRARAQYYLGLVHYHLGKYKNAVLYLRQHLQHAPESARVHSRIGMCYLQLGEVVKAREACNRALAIDPTDLQARWTLGCAMVEEGREDEALKAFKLILEDSPDHQPAFQELVRLRARRHDVEWLRAALRAEVQRFDRLPVTAERREDGQSRPIFPRQTTRERLGTLIRALGEADREAVPTLLDCIDLTTDEGLRFALWEAALDRMASQRAQQMARQLEQPGLSYSSDAGREVLALARSLPEQLLTHGLQIEEEDLRRQAVERHGPSHDVQSHRKAIDDERRHARAWQALLLLAIASHNNRSSRNLLVRWASEADPDLADAARAALVMLGDEESTLLLRKRSRSRGAENLVDAMVAQVEAPSARHPVRPAESGDDAVCSTCGRRQHESELLLVGAGGAICSHCLVEVARSRREHEIEDPEAVCALSSRHAFEVRAMYRFRGLTISREVLDDGLGRLEREAVDRYLAAL